MHKFKQLDQVKLITTSNVGWVSAPPGQVANPNGIWIVVGILEDQLLVQKEETLAKVPIIDVIKVAEYDIQQPLQKIKDLLHVGRNGSKNREEETKENVQKPD